MKTAHSEFKAGPTQVLLASFWVETFKILKFFGRNHEVHIDIFLRLKLDISLDPPSIIELERSECLLPSLLYSRRFYKELLQLEVRRNQKFHDELI